MNITEKLKLSPQVDYQNLFKIVDEAQAEKKSGLIKI